MRRTLAVFGDPGERLVDHDVSRTLVARAAVGAAWQRIAVGVEAAFEAEAAIERERRDERARGESARPQHLRERRYTRLHAHPVVTRAMPRRIDAGQQAGVRRQRDRRGREGMLDANTT
jgi:hypothetical protein